ncbi:HK97-fold major capsid protein [[Eubacterium] hominis]|uniref:HK97-fold major capsid protein n=1 Tax=[Eubacterium] hominis TaxID=2764325 RepID=UPI00204DDD4E|nr:MAG TPA: Major capsid protein [Caudoviricetes sp.]
MKKRTKLIKKVVSVGDKVRLGTIDQNDEKIEAAEEILKEIFETEDGRTELATEIKSYIEDKYYKFNFADYVFEKRRFKVTDIPTFKTHKKGIIAYKTAPDSYVPKSENYETEFTMNFVNMGVRPTAQLIDLKTGRISALSELINDAYEAMNTLTIKESLDCLSQTFNATVNKDNFVETNTVNKAALDKMINRVRKKTLKRPTIIGNYDLLTQIEAFPEYKGMEPVYNEIRKDGLLGMYRGCKLVYVPDIEDPVTHKPLFPEDRIMIVSEKVGFFATQGEMQSEQEKDINDNSWSCRIDQRYGLLVTHPEGLAVIKIVPSQD